MFSWDIGPTWQIEQDPVSISEVEVRFAADGPTRTRVDLEPRHLDRRGAGGDQGRPLYLQRCAELVA